MGKNKITYDFVRAHFQREGYSLLSRCYVDAKTKLDYSCPNDHKHSIRWGDWQHGYRCPYCAGQGKPKIEEIRVAFKEEGYILLSKEYKNNNTVLEYVCPKGHTHNITWKSWHNGNRCFYCHGSVKKPIDDIKKSFYDDNYVLLTKTYKNNRQKLKCVCPQGHKYFISWHDWQAGTRCSYCSKNAKPFMHVIKESFILENYKLLTDSYSNNLGILEYVCSMGHRHKTNWDRWRTGSRCPTCYNLGRFGASNGNWRGGASFEHYCPIWLDKEFKNYIKGRDEYSCKNPYCVSKNPNYLTIHHIDYNKKNCTLSNLITICRSCNGKANKDREWHTAWYRAILHRRYKYDYN